MKHLLVLMGLALAVAAPADQQVMLVPSPAPKPGVPAPLPVFRPSVTRDGEQPVAIETKAEIVADNGLYRRVETTVTFTNPNGRVFEGELEFPVPDGATVCGYALEIDGRMTPGVVCAKEKARAAFDNEKRKGVDPGIVEHVKGNLWKTRIYPLMPRTPRKAMVAYVEPLDGPEATAAERDGDDTFVATRGPAEKAVSVADRLRDAAKAAILWDASLSRKDKVAADRARLELLPEKGEWTLVVFRDVCETPRTFASRAELLKAVDALAYDGGTAFDKVVASVGAAASPVFLFSDETDTLSAKAPDLEKLGVVFASRPDAAPRKIAVRKLADGEKAPCDVKEGKLLATAWAANRIADLSAQADARADEFLALGRKYGVASPVTSLIVLERLDQYLEHKIEPPETSPFHAEWVRRRAATDDAIEQKRAKTEHENRLLRYWEERVTWWKDPIPKKVTPKSGVFDDGAVSAGAVPAAAVALSANVADSERRARRMSMGVDREVRAQRAVAMSAAADRIDDAEPAARMSAAPVAKCAAPAGRIHREASGGAAPKTEATVKIAAWNPKMPYLKALGDAANGHAYEAYLRERDVYGTAPSFYLDCAGWFFKTNEPALGCRIVSNLAEMKLEDVGLWRTMGWRLREAGAYDAAVNVFRHVLAIRGEEAQSRRDLALVLTERGKANGSGADLTEAANLFRQAAFEPALRRSGRRGNDFQTSVMALEELNGLLDWCAANKPDGFVAPAIDAAYRRSLPLDLRIALSWDTDETDVDLHVLEPGGEEAYYAHRRTGTGGFVSEDVTTGYGPEEYLKKTAEKGTYRVVANFFASHRQALTGAAVVTATVYTHWGTADEKREILSFRLDKPRDKCPIGEVTVR